MKNIELQLVLSKLPPDMDIATFRRGNLKLGSLSHVYVGNETYLPGKHSKTNKDVIVLEYEQK